MAPERSVRCWALGVGALFATAGALAGPSILLGSMSCCGAVGPLPTFLAWPMVPFLYLMRPFFDGSGAHELVFVVAAGGLGFGILGLALGGLGRLIFRK